MKSILRSEYSLSAYVHLNFDVFSHVSDFYISMHIHIEISHEKIVSRVIWSLEQDVLLGLRQDNVIETNSSKFKWSSLEETINHCVTAHLVPRSFKEEGTYWGMMRDLLWDKAVVWSYHFIGFTQ